MAYGILPNVPFSALPTIPFLIFGVLEPLYFLSYYLDVSRMIDGRVWPGGYYFIPHVARGNCNKPFPFVMELAFGNKLFLIAILSIVCCFSRSSATVRLYLIARVFVYCVDTYSWYINLCPGEFYASRPVMHFWSAVFKLLTVLGVFGPLKDSPRLYRGT